MTTTTPLPSQAILYQQAGTNQIGVTPSTSTNIGYLDPNKTQLEVVSSITAQNPTDMYNFYFRNGGPVTLNLTTITNSNSGNSKLGNGTVRVQLLDPTGTRVLADSAGTAAQKSAYAQLTSAKGLNLKAGGYLVKTTFAGAKSVKPVDYTIQLNSGTTFNADYRTLAATATLQQTLLAGGSLGYSPASAAAALLTNQANGTSTDIFGNASIFAPGTNIIA